MIRNQIRLYFLWRFPEVFLNSVPVREGTVVPQKHDEISRNKYKEEFGKVCRACLNGRENAATE